MKNDPNLYEDSHLACFKKNSYQNQWRKEIGSIDTVLKGT
jgi:hypothetical protein